MNNAFDLFINGAIKQLRILDEILIGASKADVKDVSRQAFIAFEQMETLEGIRNEANEDSRSKARLLWNQVMREAARIGVAQDAGQDPSEYNYSEFPNLRPESAYKV